MVSLGDIHASPIKEKGAVLFSPSSSRQQSKFGKEMWLAQGYQWASGQCWGSPSAFCLHLQASSPLISVIRRVTHCCGWDGGRVGVMGPGTRPRVLEGVFSGERAKIWARLEGPQGEWRCSLLQHLAPDPAAAAAISSDTQRSGKSNSPAELLEWGKRGKQVSPSPEAPLQPQNPALARHLFGGHRGSTHQTGPVSCGRAAQQSHGVAPPCEHRAYPAAPEKVQHDGARRKAGRASGSLPEYPWWGHGHELLPVWWLGEATGPQNGLVPRHTPETQGRTQTSDMGWKRSTASLPEHTEELLRANIVLRGLHIPSHFILTTTLWGRYYYYLHVTEEEVEAKRDELASSGLHR